MGWSRQHPPAQTSLNVRNKATEDKHSNLRIRPCSGHVWTVDLRISRLRPGKGETVRFAAFRDSHLRPPPAEGESRSFATVQRCEEPAVQRAVMGLFLAVAPNQLHSDQPRKADFRGKKVVGGVRLVPHTTRAPPGEAAVFPHSEQPIKASCLQDLLQDPLTC